MTRVELENVIPQVLSAHDASDTDGVSALLCDLLKGVHSHGGAYQYRAFLTLCLLAKKCVAVFNHPNTILHLIQRLRYNDLAPRTAALGLTLLCVHVLMELLRGRAEWPPEVVEEYLHDALQARFWVDSPLAKEFVDNVVTAFPVVGTAEVADPEAAQATPPCRYSRGSVQVEIESRVQALLNSGGNKDQQSGAKATKQTLQVMQQLLGFPKVRQIVSERIELWLGHPSHATMATLLLQQLCSTVDTDTDADLAAVDNLVRMRAAKSVTNYGELIAKLVGNHPLYIVRCLKYYLLQEAQLTKNPATSKHFAMVWKALPDGHEGVLAGIIQELAADAQRLGMIHQILKRVLRGCYPKFNLLRFCKPMLERAEDILAALRGTSDLNPAVQGRILVIVDLIVAAVVAALNLNSFLLQDAPQRRAALEEQTAHAIHQFPAQVAAVQSCCVGWFRRCHDHLSGTLRMPLPVLQQVFSMLMLQQLDLLTLPDKFDPTEKAQYLRDLEAIPVAQDTLKEVAALSTELRVLPREYALKRLEAAVGRCAEFHRNCSKEQRQALPPIDDPATLTAIFALARLEVPAPAGPGPPGATAPAPACATPHFWAACTIVTVLACLHAPQLAGHCWDQLPAVRHCLQLLLSWFTLGPSPDTAAAPADAHAAWRAAFLARYAAAGVPAAQLPPAHELMPFDVRAPAPWPPADVRQRLQASDQKWGLGQKLRRCIKPALLPLLIQREAAMDWLTLILQHEPQTLEQLPVTSLCALLVRSGSDPRLQSGIRRVLHPIATWLFGSAAESPVPPTRQGSLDTLRLLLEALGSSDWAAQTAARVAFRKVLLLPAAGAAGPSDEGPFPFGQFKACLCWGMPECTAALWGCFRSCLRTTTDHQFVAHFVQFMGDLVQTPDQALASVDLVTPLSVCEEVSRALLQRRDFYRLMASDSAFHELLQSVFVRCIRWLRQRPDAVGPPWVQPRAPHGAPRLPLGIFQGLRAFAANPLTHVPLGEAVLQDVILPFLGPGADCTTSDGGGVDLTEADAEALAQTHHDVLVDVGLAALPLHRKAELLLRFGVSARCRQRVVACLAELAPAALRAVVAGLPPSQQHRLQSHVAVLHRRHPSAACRAVLDAIDGATPDDPGPDPGLAPAANLDAGPVAASLPHTPPPLPPDQLLALTKKIAEVSVQAPAFTARDRRDWEALLAGLRLAVLHADGWVAVRDILSFLGDSEVLEPLLDRSPEWVLALFGVVAMGLPPQTSPGEPEPAHNLLESCVATAVMLVVTRADAKPRRWDMSPLRRSPRRARLYGNALAALSGWSTPACVEDMVLLLQSPVLGQLLRCVDDQPLPRVLALFRVLRPLSDAAWLQDDAEGDVPQPHTVTRLVQVCLDCGSDAAAVMLEVASRALGLPQTRIAELYLLHRQDPEEEGGALSGRATGSGTGSGPEPGSGRGWGAVTAYGMVLDVLLSSDLFYRHLPIPGPEGGPKVTFSDTTSDVTIYDRVFHGREAEPYHAALLAKLAAHVPPRHLAVLLRGCLTAPDRGLQADNVVALLGAYIDHLRPPHPITSVRRGLRPCLALPAPDPAPPPGPLSPAKLCDVGGLEAGYAPEAAAAAQQLDPECAAGLVDVAVEAVVRAQGEGDGPGEPAAHAAYRALLFVCSLGDAHVAAVVRQACRRLKVCAQPAWRAVYSDVLMFLYKAFSAQPTMQWPHLSEGVTLARSVGRPALSERPAMNAAVDGRVQACCFAIVSYQSWKHRRDSGSGIPPEELVGQAYAELCLAATKHPLLLVRHMPSVLVLLPAWRPNTQVRFHHGPHVRYIMFLKLMSKLGPQLLHECGHLDGILEAHLVPFLQDVASGPTKVALARQEYRDKYEGRYATEKEKAQLQAERQQTDAEEREAVREVALNIVAFLVDCLVTVRARGVGPAGPHAVLLRHVPLLQQVRQSLHEGPPDRGAPPPDARAAGPPPDGSGAALLPPPPPDPGGGCARLLALLQDPAQYCGGAAAPGPNPMSFTAPRAEPAFALSGPNSVLARVTAPAPAADGAATPVDGGDAGDPAAASLPYIAAVLPLAGHLANLVGTLRTYTNSLGHCAHAPAVLAAGGGPAAHATPDVCSPFATALLNFATSPTLDMAPQQEYLMVDDAGGRGGEAKVDPVLLVREVLQLVQALFDQTDLHAAVEGLCAARHEAVVGLVEQCVLLLAHDVDLDDPQDPVALAFVHRDHHSYAGAGEAGLAGGGDPDPYAAIWTSCLELVWQALTLNPSLYALVMPTYVAALAGARDCRRVAVGYAARLYTYAEEYKRPILHALWALCSLPRLEEEGGNGLRRQAQGQFRRVLAMAHHLCH